METRVISYSQTGNNDILAASIAEALGANRIRITEATERSIWRTALDMLFGRRPSVEYEGWDAEVGERVVFVAPVWMGSIASPMRDCFRRLRKGIGTYSFVSISGGADGPNPKLARELEKRLGKAPSTVVDLHIADLLPAEPAPTRDDTGAYRLTGAVAKSMAEAAMKALRAIEAAD